MKEQSKLQDGDTSPLLIAQDGDDSTSLSMKGYGTPTKGKNPMDCTFHMRQAVSVFPMQKLSLAQEVGGLDELELASLCWSTTLSPRFCFIMMQKPLLTTQPAVSLALVWHKQVIQNLPALVLSGVTEQHYYVTCVITHRYTDGNRRKQTCCEAHR
jgi:hypothetical protein